MVVSGRAAVSMNDGRELVMELGDVFAIPPGHDSWVVGDEPYVSLLSSVHPTTRPRTTEADAACRRHPPATRRHPRARALRWQLYTERETHDESFESYVAFELSRATRSRATIRAWCAEEDGRLVAAMWLHTVPRVPAPGHGDPRPMGYLTNMYVVPDRRSHGLGSEMLQTLVEHCMTSGFELVLTFPADDAYPSTSGTASRGRPTPWCVVSGTERLASRMD